MRMFPPTDGSHLHALSRRTFLSVAGAGLLANTQAIAAGPRNSVRSCILIFYYGGPSHLDTFDPKPAAPAEVRGAYRTIATTVPGVRVTEHLPRTARLMHRLA